MNTRLKIILTERNVFKFSLILLVCTMLLILLSVYQLSKTSYASIYVFLLINLLFFSFGIIVYQRGKIFSEIERYNFKDYNYYYKLLKIIFFLNISIILIILYHSIYTKGILYYLFISSLATIVLIQILIKPKNINDNFFILFFQIIPIALISVGSSYFINPYLIGPDSPWHFYYIQQIIDYAQNTLSAEHYYYFPLYHLIQAVNAIIINHFSTYTFELLNLLVFTICLPIVFLIGKALFNKKVGLISALLFSIFSSSIYLGIFNIGKIGGVVLFLLILYILIKRKKNNNFNYTILLFLSLIGVLFWHPEISIAVLIILGANVLSEFIMESRIDFISLTLFSVLFISYLVYVDTLLFTNIIQLLFVEPTGPTQTTQIVSKSLTLNILIQYSWSFIGIAASSFFISFIGFSWLSKLDKFKSLILFCLVGFVIFGGLSLISGNFGLDPERSLLYYSTLTIFIFAYGIFKIFKSKQEKILPLLVILFFIFTLASTSSYFTGDGSNILNNQLSKQTLFTTQSNLETNKFLEKTPLESNITGDSDSLRYLTNPILGFYNLPNRNFYSFTTINITNSSYFLINTPNLLRLNWENTENGKTLNNLTSEKNLLYNNGEVKIYN